MHKETKDFLDFVDQRLTLPSIDLDAWKYYLKILPSVYNSDISFRLLFDWHWQERSGLGRAWIRFPHPNINVQQPIFAKQLDLILAIGESLYGIQYQVRELILFHARVDLRGKHLLEVGGVLPNELLFDHLGVVGYINIESPDYIDAADGHVYSEKYKPDDRKRTIFCNAEEILIHLEPDSIDSIFSVACFEHIIELSAALEACHKCLKKGGTLYSYFAPIYSHIEQGDHDVIPLHSAFPEKPLGFHLLSQKDQRRKLLKAGLTDPSEVQDFLGNVNFNRIPNRLMYEDYERILTESSFYVLEFDRQENLNLSKLYAKQVMEIRKSNPWIQNLLAIGFRIHLLKG